MSNQTRFQGEHSGSTGAISNEKALTPVDKLRNQITQMGPEFSKVLPPHVSVEKFTRVVMTAIQKDPNLVRAEQASLLGACIQCATDGLIPDGREAALTTYGTKAVYMPMVGGILKKVRNSGELASITAQMIYQNDKFKYWVDGDGEHLEHEPLLFGERGEMIGVYALAKTKQGDVYIEPMTKVDVDKVRKVSKAQNGPWASWYDEMAKKTAIRRLSKRLPMSTDLEDVIRRDDDLHDFKDVSPKTSSIQERLSQIPVATEPKVAVVVNENLQDDEYLVIPDAPQKTTVLSDQAPWDTTHQPKEISPEAILTFGKFSGMAVGSIPKEELVTVYTKLKASQKVSEQSDTMDETILIIKSYLGLK